MAHGRQEFAPVVYSEGLQRRPLRFVEPIPASRICSACGNIPRLTYMLLCGHTFCEPCYESCATTSECVCPLDGEACVTKDVSSKDYIAENLLKRKVYCLNEANGCRVILEASQVAEHVTCDCQYHVTNCPTCLAAVLSRDVCAHLKSRCTQLVLHAAPEPQQGADNNEKTHLLTIEREMEQRARELDTKLAKLSLDSGTQNDKLIELCHNINHLKETSDRNAAEIKALYSEQREAFMTAITSVLKSVPGDAKTHQRVIKGYAALKERALKKGWSLSMSDKVYLRRYLLSWGILFEKEGDSVYLYLRIELHKGREDDILDWPFTKELKLSIIHPETREQRLLRDTPKPTGDNMMHYSRPIEASNPPVYFSATKVQSSDIEGNGYVKRDQLLVMLEVSL